MEKFPRSLWLLVAICYLSAFIKGHSEWFINYTEARVLTNQLVRTVANASKLVYHCEVTLGVGF